eukprot:TRINITY_DN7821_c0_g1_i1.p1 TRINITY_DN7821_c0_g1~~TRINITY_DN7821_c0_g1_i1.p1  ORF type:complete len:563 (+),score=133.20 TRINITY_DN7821_c0_g1_i1:74-1690(+)
MSAKVKKVVNYEKQMRTHPNLKYILDDLLSRFVLNVPPEELSSFNRVLFQMELAHWFYIDYYREADPTLPKYPIRAFITALFHRCPLLHSMESKVDKLLLSWVTYKISVPVFGVIILNDRLDKVLLVKGFSKGSTWGFPKGKVNKGELGIDCAVREAWEETSLDCIGFINDKNSIVITFQRQRQQLFIVADVEEETMFKPQTKGEISSIEWHYIADIPKSYKEGKQGTVNRSSKFFTVIPFIPKLIAWAKAERKVREKNRKKKRKQIPATLAATLREHRVESQSEAALLHHFSPLATSHGSPTLSDAVVPIPLAVTELSDIELAQLEVQRAEREKRRKQRQEKRDRKDRDSSQISPTPVTAPALSLPPSSPTVSPAPPAPLSHPFRTFRLTSINATIPPVFTQPLTATQAGGKRQLKDILHRHTKCENEQKESLTRVNNSIGAAGARLDATLSVFSELSHTVLGDFVASIVAINEAIQQKQFEVDTAHTQGQGKGDGEHHEEQEEGKGGSENVAPSESPLSPEAHPWKNFKVDWSTVY